MISQCFTLITAVHLGDIPEESIHVGHREIPVALLIGIRGLADILVEIEISYLFIEGLLLFRQCLSAIREYREGYLSSMSHRDQTRLHLVHRGGGGVLLIVV
jgi:hypothetical protein